MSEIAFDVVSFDVVLEDLASEVDVVTVEGPPGPQGPPGTSTGSAFEWEQSTPAATWTINHDLGRFPYNSEVTVDGEVVFADVEYPDSSTAVVVFASPTSGVLRLV